MKIGNYELQATWFWDLVDQRLAEKHAKEHAEGRAEGLRQGRYEGERDGLFEVLDARGLQVDDASRQQIMACRDLEQLKVWLRKAVTAESVQELFEHAPASKPTAR